VAHHNPTVSGIGGYLAEACPTPADVGAGYGAASSPLWAVEASLPLARLVLAGAAPTRGEDVLDRAA
jgi:hypothetical protein